MTYNLPGKLAERLSALRPLDGSKIEGAVLS